MDNRKFLRRYTDLPSLLHILKNGEITLLDPGSWEDKNDASYLEIFKQKKQLRTILALCFTEADETYHHWKVFASGASGICIAFDRDAFLRSVSTAMEYGKLTHKKVQYKTLKALSSASPSVAQLPFLKRYPYRDEQEYRLVFSSTDQEIKSLSIPFEMSAISRISLSPWLPRGLVDTVKEAIRGAVPAQHLDVYQTTVNENQRWKSIGESAS